MWALVIYNGKRSPYPYHLDIANLFSDIQLYNKAPLGTFALLDLTVTSDDELLKHRKLALLEVLLKHINGRDFNNFVRLTIKALKIGMISGLSKTLFNSSFAYLMNAKEPDDINHLIKQIKIDTPDVGENIMTYAEKLRDESEQKGRMEGMKEGLQLGKQEGVQLGKREA